MENIYIVDDTKVSELFNISGRFLRSAHLERDFNDARGLEDYILSDYTQNCLQRTSIGLEKNQIPNYIQPKLPNSLRFLSQDQGRPLETPFLKNFIDA